MVADSERFPFKQYWLGRYTVTTPVRITSCDYFPDSEDPLCVGFPYYYQPRLKRIEPTIGVYQIRNLVTEQRYIGSSANLHARMASHINHLDSYRHHCRPLQKDWDTYGRNSFAFEILQEVESEYGLYDREQGFMARVDGRLLYNTTKTPGHYQRLYQRRMRMEVAA